MKILWIDDQIEVVSTFSMLLAPLKADVIFEKEAENALVKIKNEGGYDLILVDLRMPPGEWGGLWLLEKLKLEGIDIPAIVLSGEGSQTETILAIRLGAIDYVKKDKITEELLPRVQSFFQDLDVKKNKDIEQLLQNGESDCCEFKATLLWNIKAKMSDPEITFSAFKTIAAFLNSKGGILLIGVSNESKILGLIDIGPENGKFLNIDELWCYFSNKIKDHFGADFSLFVNVQVIQINEKEIFKVTCKQCNKPVFLIWKKKGDNEEREYFFVRNGPTTEELSPTQLVNYINERFKK